MGNMINTEECEQCLHSTLDETNKAKIMVYCKQKDKWYIYGQCIPCEDKIKRNKKNDVFVIRTN